MGRAFRDARLPRAEHGPDRRAGNAASRRPWISPTSPGPRSRCGRPTPRRRATPIFSTSRPRTSRARSGSASPPPNLPQGRSRRGPSRSRAVSRSIPPSSPTMTAGASCISAASGAGSCNGISAAATIRTARKPIWPPTTSRPWPPKVALMSADMTEFAEKPRDVVILDEAGKHAAGRRSRSPLLRGIVDAQT